MAYLDHDHRERENVGRFGTFSSIADLWGRPSRAEAALIRSAPYRIQVSSDLGETEIRDAYLTGVFHKDVGLVGRRYSVNKTQSNHVPL